MSGAVQDAIRFRMLHLARLIRDERKAIFQSAQPGGVVSYGPLHPDVWRKYDSLVSEWSTLQKHFDYDIHEAPEVLQDMIDKLGGSA